MRLNHDGSRLRVLHVTPSVAPRDGGPSVAIMAMTRALRDRGVASITCSTDASGRVGRLSATERARIACQGDVRFFRVHWPHRMKTSLGMVLPLLPRTREADIVHIHYLNAWSCLVATVYCRLLKKAYVVQPHGGLEPYDLAKRRRVKALFELISGTVRNADALVLATEAESDRITTVPRARKFVVPHGAEEVVPDRAASATREPRVLFLSRLAPVKRADILLRAWPRVMNSVPAARLHLVGPDTDGLLDGYRQLAVSRGLESAVSFPGQLLGADKSRAFAGATIFALPSENESFGIAVAEALSAGLPVIVSKHVAIADEITEAGAGIVVPTLEPEDWASAIVALLQDDAARAAMSVAARRLASERYSWSQAAKRIEQLYFAILTQRASSR